MHRGSLHPKIAAGGQVSALQGAHRRLLTLTPPPCTAAAYKGLGDAMGLRIEFAVRILTYPGPPSGLAEAFGAKDKEGAEIAKLRESSEQAMRGAEIALGELYAERKPR